jgi:hypothetical protein
MMTIEFCNKILNFRNRCIKNIHSGTCLPSVKIGNLTKFILVTFQDVFSDKQDNYIVLLLTFLFLVLFYIIFLIFLNIVKDKHNNSYQTENIDRSRNPRESD